jgi:hypothetical protein
MSQLHKRFTDDQIKVLLQGYIEGKMSRAEIQEMFGIGKTRFFSVLKKYKQDPENFTLAYHRATPARLTTEMEAAIRDALLKEKEIVGDPNLPISGYNYTAMCDRLKKQGIKVSVTTIIDRAKKLNCHKPRKKRKVHDREVLTSSIGALVQHDSSHHQWSPFADEKWYLITSIDDYSRKLLFADFVPKETTWAHIQASQALIKKFGMPLRFYVDSLRVFRFVQGRDSLWRKHVLETDDVDTQWGKMMRLMGIDVTHALSPQAKGKIERPYRWMQDRIVRASIYEKLSSIDEVRSVLKSEVNRYNNHQVHSTTGEIPEVRYRRALNSGNSLFRKFTVPQPFSSPLDVFCLRTSRIVNAYRKISLFNHKIDVPNVPLYHDVKVHLIPNINKEIMLIRIWWNKKLVHRVSLPLHGFRVHL